MTNQFRYKLFSNILGERQLKDDPKGWNEDSQSIERKIDKAKAGIVYTFANGIEFVGDGQDYVDTCLRLESFEANILVKREKRNFQDRWVVDYEGRLDLVTMQRTRFGIQMDIVDANLADDVKNVYNDAYELNKNTSLDGQDIGELAYRPVLHNGREILVTTKLEDTEEKTITGSSVEIAQGVFRSEQFYIANLNKTYSGDEAVQSVFAIPNVIDNDASNAPPNSASQFFLHRSTESATRSININIDSTIIVAPNLVGSGSINAGFSVFKYKYIDQGNYDYVDVYPIVSNNTISNNTATNLIADIDIDIPLEVDECLFLRFFCNANDTDGQTLWTLTQRSVVIDMNSSSTYPQTNATGLTILDTLKRLCLINFGHDRVRSDYLENGEFKDLLITSGKRIRGFEDSIETSFKTVIESIKPVVNLCYGVERINGVDYLKVEPFEYFFSPDETLEINGVYNVQRKFLKKELFSGINIGYEGNFEYEENQGLDEPNTRSEFSHNLKKLDQQNDYLSKIRSDTFGIELARRKPFVDFPDEDTKYDKPLFFLDCYKVQIPVLGVGLQDFYLVRRWAKDFTSLPTGIYSPETAYNLRLTPKNNLFRCSNSFAHLSEFNGKTTIFRKSERNADLATTLIGGSERVERSDVPNSDLRTPLLKPVEITMQVKLTEDQLSKLRATENGVPNFYKLLKITDDENNEVYGYLLSYDPNDEGNLIIIEANI